MCLTSHWPTIFSIRVNLLILTMSVGEIKDKIFQRFNKTWRSCTWIYCVSRYAYSLSCLCTWYTLYYFFVIQEFFTLYFWCWNIFNFLCCSIYILCELATFILLCSTNWNIIEGEKICSLHFNFFSPTCPKAKFRKIFLFIQANSFIIFTCLIPVLLVPGFWQVG